MFIAIFLGGGFWMIEITGNSKIHGLKKVFLSQMEEFGGLRYTGIPKYMV